MLQIFIFKTCVVFGTKHTGLLFSLLRHGIIKFQNVGVGFVLGGEVALLGFYGVLPLLGNVVGLSGTVLVSSA